jgi:predicted NUDIX family NTP pyrophosphohydrolase
MSLHSAGILLYRYRDDELEVFLVHPGGPFWANRDEGAWSIPKGLIEDNEACLEAAQRELKEETGFDVAGRFIELGQLRQPSKKIVHAWALGQDVDASKLNSNTFTLEWPGGSGLIREYPEVDKGAWFDLGQARTKMHKGQVGFLDRLLERLAQAEKA